MVAVSLYRGYLHNVPDVPRQWPVPTPKISLKSFKILLRRRARALSRLHQSSDANANAPSNSNPNPNPSNSNIQGRSRAVYAVNNNDKKKKNDDNNNRDRNDKRCSKPKLTFKEEEMGKVKGVKLVDGGDFVTKSADKADAALMEKEKKKKKNEESVKHPEKTEVVVAANLEPEVLEFLDLKHVKWRTRPKIHNYYSSLMIKFHSVLFSKLQLLLFVPQNMALIGYVLFLPCPSLHDISRFVSLNSDFGEGRYKNKNRLQRKKMWPSH